MHFVLKVIIGNFHQMYTIVFYGGGLDENYMNLVFC